jgi:hypothetical protein
VRLVSRGGRYLAAQARFWSRRMQIATTKGSAFARVQPFPQASALRLCSPSAQHAPALRPFVIRSTRSLVPRFREGRSPSAGLLLPRTSPVGQRVAVCNLRLHFQKGQAYGHELWNVASVVFANGSRSLRRLTSQGAPTATLVSPGLHVQAALTAIRGAERRSWPATGLSLGRSA